MNQCHDCGAATAARRRYCETCRAKRTRDAKRRWFRENRLVTHPIGSIIRCEDCDVEMEKLSGAHKVCAECSRKRHRASIAKYHERRMATDPEYRERFLAYHRDYDRKYPRGRSGVPIGSIIRCEDCDVEMEKRCGSHKLCAACARDRRPYGRTRKAEAS